MTGLHLSLLGRYVASLDNQPAIKFKTVRAQALLAYLATENGVGGVSHRRETLMDLLWLDLPTKSARSNLRQTLYYLHQSIVDLPTPDSQETIPYLLTDRSTVRVNPDYPVRVDVMDFDRILAGSEQRWPEAIALYQGDFLTDFYLPDANTFEEWASARRAAYRRQVLQALDALTTQLLEAGSFDEAEGYALRQLDIDNLRESTYRQLMQIYAWSGRQSEALTLYQECSRILDEELNSPPDQATTALYEAIRENQLPPAPLKPDLLLQVVPEEPAGPPPSPYRGLFAFREEDAPYFFGREGFTERLVELAKKQALIAVIGPSGSGKSSVLHAGLLARIRQEDDWIIATFRPGSQPFHALAAALLPLLEPEMTETERMVETRRLTQALKEEELPLTDVVERISQKNNNRRLLLVADQFEELYALSQDIRAHLSLLDALLETVADQQSEAKPAFCFAFALRADFLDLVLDYRPFADAMQDASLILAPMTHEELGRAIEKPAEMLSVAFEPGLVERILTDIGDERGNLPLLEFALTSLWERQDNRQLTHAAYEEIGRVEGALARYADEVYDGFEPSDQERARHLFVQLVRPGRQTGDTRRLSQKEELGEENWNLAQRLADARLVVIDRDPAGQETVELVHETLIRRWGRLQDWLEEDRAFRVWQERLRASLYQWQTSGRDEGALLRGAPLTEAESWLGERREQLGPAELEYIEAGCALQDRRERTRRLVTIGLAIGLILAIGLATLAAWQWNSARQARLVAENERDQTQNTLSYLLASQAQLLLEDQLDLSLLLASEALNKAESPETRSALLAAVSHNPYLRSYIQGYPDQVRAVAISPDGSTLAFGGDDNTIVFWDLATGQQKDTPLSEHTDNVRSLAFSPDGRFLASGSFDDTVILWDLATSPPKGVPLIGHKGDVWRVAFSPGSELLVSGAADGTVRFWDPHTGQPVGDSINAHNGAVAALAFSPTGRVLASAGRDNSALLWDVSSLTEAAALESADPEVRQLGQPLKGHSGFVRALGFSPDGQLLAMDGDDNAILLWDVSAAGEAAGSDGDSTNPEDVVIEQIGGPISGHEDWVTSLAFAPDNRLLASADRNGQVVLWDIPTSSDGGLANGMEGRALTGQGEPIWDLTFSPDGDTLVTGAADGRLTLWDVTGQHPLGRRLDGPGGRVTSVALSPDGQILATGSGDGSLSFFDVGADAVTFGRQLSQTSTGHSDTIRSISFSLDGHLLATSGDDNQAILWNVDSLAPSILFTMGHDDQVYNVVFSPDGRSLASVVNGRTIHLWDVNTGQLLQTLPIGNPANIPSMSFSPDDEWLVYGATEGLILLEIAMLEKDSSNSLSSPVSTPFRHGSGAQSGQPAVFEIAFNPDSQFLAYATLNEGIILQDLRTGERIGQLSSQHRGEIIGLAFNPDGDTLVSIGEDGQVILWDMAQDSTSFGQPIGPAISGPKLSSLAGISFSQDAGILATTRPDGSINLWDIDLDSWRSLACRRAGRNLTQDEWRQFFGEEPYRLTCPELPAGADSG